MTVAVLPLHVEAIPGEMAAEWRWVAWRFEMRGSKPTKVPISPHTGRHASSTEPADRGTLDDALARMECDRLAGIGFVLGDGWAGVDQDHCVDPATRTLMDWAAKNVQLLDSYTEVSPRGEGVKTIARGRLPAGRRRKGLIEMYDAGRFFTVTGHHLEGTTHTVEERTDALCALHRRVFGADGGAAAGRPAHVWTPSPCSSPPGALWDRVGRGRIKRTTLALLDSTGPAGYTSPSEADAAIAAGPDRRRPYRGRGPARSEQERARAQRGGAGMTAAEKGAPVVEGAALDAAWRALSDVVADMVLGRLRHEQEQRRWEEEERRPQAGGGQT
jgi:hypothetical protein